MTAIKLPKGTQLKCRKCGEVLSETLEDVEIRKDDLIEDTVKRLNPNYDKVSLDRHLNYGYVYMPYCWRCNNCETPMNVETELRLLHDELKWS